MFGLLTVVLGTGSPQGRVFTVEEEFAGAVDSSMLRDCRYNATGVSNPPTSGDWFVCLPAGARFIASRESQRGCGNCMNAQNKKADEAQAFLASLVESSPDAIVGMTLDGTVVSWNQGAENIYGYRAEEIVGKPAVVLSAPDRATETPQFLERVGRGEPVRQFETVRQRKDGTQVEVALTLAPVRNAAGTATAIAAIAHDITARKRREQQTRLLTAALESTASGIVITDREGQILWVNPAFTRLTGYLPDDVAGQPTRVLRPGANEPSYYQELWATVLGGDAWHGEIVSQRKDGSLFDEEMTVTPIRDEDGSIQHVVAIKQDISERKREQEELLFKTALLETEAETTLDGILVVDGKGRTLQSNRRFAEIFELPPHLLSQDDGGSMLGYISSRVQDSAGFLARVEYLYAHESEKERDQIQLKDGRCIDRYTAPLLNAFGGYYGRVWYFRDITDRERTEQALWKARISAEEANRNLRAKQLTLESERRILHALIDNIPDFMYVKDAQSRFMIANVHAARMMGAKSPDELVGKTDFDFYPAELARCFYEDEQGVLRSGEPLHDREETCVDKAGHEIKILTNKVPFCDNEGRIAGIAGVGRDITARKRAEQALREGEERYRELFENASEIIFTTDMDGRFTSLNRAGQQAFGYSRDEAAQTDIWQIVAPEYRERLKQDLGRMLAGETRLTSEIEVAAKDGPRARHEAKPRLIWQGEHPVGVQVIARDITGRDIAEMELRQAQKLESVGRLASGIAHEINTPIQFVGDNTRFLEESFASLKRLLGEFGKLRDAAAAGRVNPELLEEVRRAEEDSDCAYLVEEIPRAIAQTLEGVDRVATIVRAMKEFAHPEGKGMAPVDLNKALASTITVARNEWKYVAEIETDLRELPPVVCNVGDLNQVFLNLLVNAAHAIGDVVKDGGKGRITIGTAEEGDKVHISIADTGAGIPESIPKIFDPFFTTKEVGRGTGQGLAIARTVVVERHKGTLTFESEVGKGTTFHIRLPVSPEKAAAEMRGR